MLASGQISVKTGYFLTVTGQVTRDRSLTAGLCRGIILSHQNYAGGYRNFPVSSPERIWLAPAIEQRQPS